MISIIIEHPLPLFHSNFNNLSFLFPSSVQLDESRTLSINGATRQCSSDRILNQKSTNGKSFVLFSCMLVTRDDILC
ncbi:B-box zinc finger protein 19 isoform F [Glycine soja]|uniref:B-box zinc finger protein 19 isoform E n=1 Tax=Glycine soja TaxID=3848 RepID=A0A445HY97_GLYSO|nr:B-box zinc finger protein 19 isoform E [Glycine soja]RZB78798.1 B-box zinc finger protein 19 isoform F [Glycine soja]